MKDKITLTKEEYSAIIDALIFLSAEVCADTIDMASEDRLLELAKKIKDATGADCKNVYVYEGEFFENEEHMKKVKEYFNIRVHKLTND